MTWIVAGIVVGASAAYGAYQGHQQGEAYDDASAAARGIQKERVGLLGEEKDLKLQNTQNQFKTGSASVGMGANMQLRRSQAFGESAYKKSGFATSGAIENKVETQNKDLVAKYSNDMKKLFDTRNVSRTEADLSFRKGEISAEEAYQNTMAGMDDSNWLEGGISGGLSAGAAVVSDRRLKRNIDYIGDSPSGIKVYEFSYINDTTRFRGVMANELVDSYPAAVSRFKDGYYRIDYSQIDVNFETV